MQYYDDFRAEGVTFPNEAEFRAYRLLLQMRDGDVGRRTQRIPPEVFASPWIQVAITLRSLLQHPSSAKSGRAPSVPYAFTRLLKELKKPSTNFLMACLVNTHLMTLRKETLRAMAGSYLNISISVPTFQNLLGFNTPGEAEAFATEAGLRILTEKSPREIAVNKSVAQKIASCECPPVPCVRLSLILALLHLRSTAEPKSNTICLARRKARRLEMGRHHRWQRSSSRDCCSRGTPNSGPAFSVRNNNTFSSNNSSADRGVWKYVCHDPKTAGAPCVRWDPRLWIGSFIPRIGDGWTSLWNQGSGYSLWSFYVWPESWCRALIWDGELCSQDVNSELANCRCLRRTTRYAANICS